MADREYQRDRRWRDEDYERNRDFFDRNYYDRSYYNRNYYDRDYYNEGRFAPYNRTYGPGYEYDDDYLDYGYDYGGTPYSGWVNGPYTGVGPRNYRRSDERIQDDVNDRLTWHGYLDARDIEVRVDDGVVTLSGTVDSRRAKRMAEDVADNVPGVWDVNNNLTIREPNRRTGYRSTKQMQAGQIREGMEVVGRDNDSVGQVKEVRANDFLVDRSLARDVYVPFSAARIVDGRIRLNVEAGEVDNQGWETPELVETS